MPRKICVITGSRAEYGLLRPLLRRLDEDTQFTLQLVVIGTHLSRRHGQTIDDIIADGFNIAAQAQTVFDNATPIDIARNLTVTTAEVSGILEGLKPDLIVLLGDRYEIFGAAIVAACLAIPVAHIHGGELTQGANDDAMRHAITKLSHIHFVSTAAYAWRVVQMGENPAQVYNVGALGVENVLKQPFLEKADLERELGFKFRDKNILITQHPVTLAKDPLADSVQLFEALASFDDVGMIFTQANADIYGDKINEMIRSFVENNPNSIFVPNLGTLRYISAMKHADVVVGNSSSGIIEAPALGRPTLNIGDRQKGRLVSTSVINCAGNTDAIRASLTQALNGNGVIKASSIYGKGDTSNQIIEVLRQLEYDNLLIKQFFDLDPYAGFGGSHDQREHQT